MTSNERFEIISSSKPKKLNILPQNPEEADIEKAVGLGRFPSWLHRPLPKGDQLRKTGESLSKNLLHTVCEEAKCPNLMECWSKGTATFLIMGKACSRNCGFCDIDFTKEPSHLDLDEPERVANSVKELRLKHVVITMVARDDLKDGGSAHLVAVIKAIRSSSPESTIEVLTSDFNGNENAWLTVLEALPDIFNHNIETIRELTPRVRHKATYDRTLSLLKFASNYHSKGIKVKSGMMLGLGEQTEQVHNTLKDLKKAGCDIVTMGQYLQPNRNKLLVKAFITPEQFKNYEQFGYEIGIPTLYCGPFVRSSYNAGEILKHER
jgi:lipoyl synthase